MVRSGDPAGPVQSVRSVQLARSGRSGQAPKAQIRPGPARTTRPSRPEYRGINFTKNMYLEHKPLKFSYPKSLCGVVGSPWVPLRTLVGFWESLTHFDKIPESRLLFGPVGRANLSFSVRSVHRGDTLVRSVRPVAYISEFCRSGPTVVEIRSGGPTGPVPRLS